MKILIITNASDNVRTHRLSLLKHLADQGYEVHVAAPDPAQTLKSYDFFISHPLYMSRGGVNPLEDLRTCADIYKIIKKIQPILIHNFTIKPVLYGTLMGLLNSKVTIINTITGLGVMFRKSGLIRSIIEKIYALIGSSKRVIFITQNKVEKEIMGKFVSDPARLYLIPGSGVDPAKFHPDPAITVVPDRILFPARMLYDKGAADLVEAHRILKAKGMNIELRFVGGIDPENPAAISEEQLRQWVKTGMISWKGAVRDMAAEYNAAAIVCLPSYHEGLPKVLLEAGACARPVIGTDIPGIRELLVSSDMGLRVPVRNPERLAEAIRIYLESPDLANQHAQALYQHVLDFHDSKKVCIAYTDVYNSYT